MPCARPRLLGGRAFHSPNAARGKPGVSLSQRLTSIMEALHHTLFTYYFFHMPYNGSAIPCTLIHQAPAPERPSTDYGPLRPQTLHATSPPSAQSRLISPVRITAGCRTQDPSHCLLHRPVQRQADCMTIPQIAVAWSVKAWGRPHTNLPEPLK